jgi:hypothetical protein
MQEAGGAAEWADEGVQIAYEKVSKSLILLMLTRPTQVGE